MKSRMLKLVCTVWGHQFVLTPTSSEYIRGGHEALCRRCGKERFRTHSSEAFPDIEMNSTRTSMVNFRNQGLSPRSELRQ